MLAGDSGLATYAFVASENYDPANQFVLATEYDATTNAPRAVLTLRSDLGDEGLEVGLQVIRLELRAGDAVLESQTVLVDIAEDAFLESFAADRRNASQSPAGPSGGGYGLQSNLSLEELLDVASFLEGRGDGSLSDAAQADYYSSYTATLIELANLQNGASAEIAGQIANDHHALSVAGFGLVAAVREDLTNANSELAVAAESLRSALAGYSAGGYSAFALGYTQVVAHEWRGGGSQEFVLALVDEPAFNAGERLRVELGDYAGMVQATITRGEDESLSLALATWVDNATRDTTVSEDSPSTPLDGGLLVSAVNSSGTGRSDAIFTLGLGDHLGAVPTASYVQLGVDSVLGTSNQTISAHWDFWGISSSTGDLWDESQLTWNQYQADLADGFRGVLDTVSVSSAGGSAVFEVSEAVRRALVAGDANLDGEFRGDLTNRAGDIEAMHLAVRDLDAYLATYGAVAGETGVVSDDELLYRVDMDWDDAVTPTDMLLLHKRLNFRAGDFNFDGRVDGYDYSLWQANYGRAVQQYQHGDANADGVTNSADYLMWRDTEDLTHGTPLNPSITFRVSTVAAGVNAQVKYDSIEDAGVNGGSTPQAPVLLSAGTSDVVITSFTQSASGSGWDIGYLVLNEAFSGSLQLVVTPTGSSSSVATVGSLSTAKGSHTTTIQSLNITLGSDPSAMEGFSASIVSSGSTLSQREFAGGIFRDSVGRVHFYGSEGDDRILISDYEIAIGATHTEPLPGGGSTTYAVGAFAQTFSLYSNPASAVYIHGRGGNDRIATEAQTISLLHLDGGSGDDLYLVIPDDSELYGNTSVVIKDSSGFDKLTLASYLEKAAPLDLQSSNWQALGDGYTTNTLSLKFISEDAIQTVQGYAHEVAGLGYSSEILVVDNASALDDGVYTAGELSFREAMMLAEAIPGAHTIEFDDELFTGGAITIAVGDNPRTTVTHDIFIVNQALTINGKGRDLLTIDGEGTGGIFSVKTTGQLTLRDLSVTGGIRTGAGSDGGAMEVYGTTSVERTRWYGNSAVGSPDSISGGQGGAIAAYSADLTIIDSTFDDNEARWGGAVYFKADNQAKLLVSGSTFHDNYAGNFAGHGGYGGAVTVYSFSSTAGGAHFENTTISGNHAYHGAGAVFVQGNTSSSPLEIAFVNSTIVLNEAGGPGNGGGGIYNQSAGDLTLHNTILAENIQNLNANPNSTQRFDLWVYNTPSKLHAEHNFVGVINQGVRENFLPAAAGNLTLASNQFVGLLPLSAVYGGANPTHALTQDSLAINEGNNALAVDAVGQPLLFDGRSMSRVVGGVTDIGAVEYGFFLDGSGTLHVYGTAADDQIDISATHVTRNSQSDFETLALAGISFTGIEVHAGDGDDIIDASLSPVAVVIRGEGGDDSLLGSSFDDWLYGGEGSDTYRFEGSGSLGSDKVIDTGEVGRDTLDFSALEVVGQGVTVNLQELVWNCVTTPSNISLAIDFAGYDSIENVIGTNGDDSITLNHLGNRIEGGDGDDTYYFAGDTDFGFVELVEKSGEGTDTLDFDDVNVHNVLNFSWAYSGVYIDLTSTTPYHALGDLYRYMVLDLGGGNEFENVVGTYAGDTFVGNAQDNIFYGDSYDTFAFRGDGDQGYDQIKNDSLYGWEYGNAKLDFSGLELGEGITIDLNPTSGTSLLTVGSLGAQLALDLSDVLGEFKSIVGTPYADTIIGNSWDNRIEGHGGDDILIGRDGHDTYAYSGGPGHGVDTIYELDGEGTDTLDFLGLEYGIGVGVVVDLRSVSALTQIVDSPVGDLCLDLSNAPFIEDVIGTFYDDVLYSNHLDNRLDGQHGSDTYVFAGSDSHGSDVIVDRGGFNDVVSFALLDYGVGLGIDLSSSTIVSYNDAGGGSSPPRSLSVTVGSSDMESAVGTAYNDILTGNSLDNHLVGLQGDDTYRFTGGTLLGTDRVYESAGGGVDTIDLAGLWYAATIDLGFTSGPQLVTVDAADWRSFRLDLSDALDLENVIGTDYADTISGNGLDNELDGRGGSDTYRFAGSGNHGKDTITETASYAEILDFSGLTYGTGIIIDLESQSSDYTLVSNGANRVALDMSVGLHVGTVIGTQYADTLRGDSNGNHLIGGGGVDFLEGRGGWQDIYEGGEGYDLFAIAGYHAIADGTYRILQGVGYDGPTIEIAPASAATGVIVGEPGVGIVLGTVSHPTEAIGDLEFNFTNIPPREITVESNGDIVWTPDENYPGRTLDITIEVTDTLYRKSTFTVTTVIDENLPAQLGTGGSHGTAIVTLTVGDDSGSYSELWKMKVGNVTHQAPGYGKVSSKDYELERGQSHTITLQHGGTRLDDGSDYDWIAGVSTQAFAILENPTYQDHDGLDFHLLGSYNNGEEPGHPNAVNNASGKTAKLHLPIVNLDIAGLSDENEENGRGQITLTKGLAKITLDPIAGAGAAPGYHMITFGNHVNLYMDSEKTVPVSNGTQFLATEGKTFYAEKVGNANVSITATFVLDDPTGLYSIVGGAGSDTVALFQEAIVIGVDGTDSAGIISTLDSGDLIIREGTHVRNFVFDAYATEKKLVEGPPGWPLGSQSKEVFGKAKDAYEASRKELGRDVPIAIVGWSRGATVALWMANVMHAEGVNVDFLGLYDPVDKSGWIPNSLTRSANTGGTVAGVASQEGTENKDYIVEMPRLLDLTFIQELTENEIAGVQKKLFNASHGALGGIPGYNDVWQEDARGMNHNYSYSTDVWASEEADMYIREKAVGSGIVINPTPVYMFPEEDPDWPESD